MAEHWAREDVPWLDLRDDPTRRLCLASVKTGNRPGSCPLGDTCRNFHALKPIAYAY